MKKLLIAIFVPFLFLLSACSSSSEMPEDTIIQPTMYPSPSITEYFPLKQGAYWIYEGTVKWTVLNSSDVKEETITWKMEVVRVFERNNVMGYEMRGAPWDLAWYEEDKEPSEYGIVQTGGKFYKTPVETILRLMDENDVLRALVDESQILLEAPLLQGKKFCDTFSITRADGMYCWTVGKESSIDATEIEGVVTSSTLFEYPIYQWTMPDRSGFSFIPKVGISEYYYMHAGTISEVDVRLIKYYAGE